VREAISYAINRQAYAKALGFGMFTPAYQVADKSCYGYNPALKPREYNPKKAKQLLGEAGYPDGFKMTIVGSARPSYLPNLFAAIKADLAKVGIEVKLDLVNPSRIRVLRYEGGLKTNSLIGIHVGQDIEYIAKLNADYNTASSLLPELRRSEGLDDLISAAKMADSTEKKIKGTQAVIKKIYDDVMVYPIWVEHVAWPMTHAVQNPPYGKIDHSHVYYTETWLKQK